MLTGTELSVDPANLVYAAQQCSAGRYATGISSSGELECAAIAATDGSVYSTTGGALTLGGTMDVATLTLPAGKYLLAANVVIIQRDADTASSAVCFVGNGSFLIRAMAGENGEWGGSGTGVVDHPGGVVKLRCQETSADVDIVSSQLFASSAG